MSPKDQSQLFEKLSLVRSQIKDQTKLIIVSKTRSVEEIKAYYDLGHRDFGENKVQELFEKSQSLLGLCPDIRWHMIGHLQSNKINQLFSVPHLWAIHSVDSLDLIKKLIKSESRLRNDLKLFLQLKTSQETEKYGFENIADVKLAIQELRHSARLTLYGLMTMGVIRTENFEQEARRCFQELNAIKNELSNDLQLTLQSSMGMSQDYLIALQENSNWIRLGTVMFE